MIFALFHIVGVNLNNSQIAYTWPRHSFAYSLRAVYLLLLTDSLMGFKVINNVYSYYFGAAFFGFKCHYCVTCWRAMCTARISLLLLHSFIHSVDLCFLHLPCCFLVDHLSDHQSSGSRLSHEEAKPFSYIVHSAEPDMVSQ